MHSASDNAIGREPGLPPKPPQAEPEIIPPSAEFPSRRHGDTFVFARRGTRIHVTRLRPFGIAMLLAGAGALGAIGLLMLLGAALVGAAAMGVIILATLFSRLFQGPARP